MNLLLVVKWVITIWMLVIAPATCDIVFDLNQPDSYGKFVEQLRNEIKDPKNQFFGIPVIKVPNPKNQFLYIEVKAAENGKIQAISITLQIKIENLYVVAYRDKDENSKDRYFYFKKVGITEKDVFPHVKNIKPMLMKCDHNYGSLETVSHKKIKELVFQLPKLEEVMRNANGKSTTQTKDFPKRQASFLLYSILMTSEATRFKYIEQKTVKKQNSDVKVASLVKEWDKLSVQIIGADKKTGKFKETIRIQTSETTPPDYLVVDNVAVIKSDMGILLNKNK